FTSNGLSWTASSFALLATGVSPFGAVVELAGVAGWLGAVCAKVVAPSSVKPISATESARGVGAAGWRHGCWVVMGFKRGRGGTRPQTQRSAYTSRGLHQVDLASRTADLRLQSHTLSAARFRVRRHPSATGSDACRRRGGLRITRPTLWLQSSGWCPRAGCAFFRGACPKQRERPADL